MGTIRTLHLWTNIHQTKFGKKKFPEKSEYTLAVPYVSPQTFPSFHESFLKPLQIVPNDPTLLLTANSRPSVAATKGRHRREHDKIMDARCHWQGQRKKYLT